MLESVLEKVVVASVPGDKSVLEEEMESSIVVVAVG